MHIGHLYIFYREMCIRFFVHFESGCFFVVEFITPWEIDGETVETVSDFILGGSKITADGDCSQKLKDAYSLEEKL